MLFRSVNFWSMPITMEINGATGNVPPKLGQPATLLRTKVFDAFQPFINAETNLAGDTSLKNAYLGLANSVAIVSPLTVLPASGSPFNTAFDSTLVKLFGGPAAPGLRLRMTGDSGGTYTGTPTADSSGYYLNFVNDTGSEFGQFRIYSPLTPNPAGANGTSGFQVFGCVGVFKNPVIVNDPSGDAVGIGRYIAAALNREIGRAHV